LEVWGDEKNGGDFAHCLVGQETKLEYKIPYGVL